MKVFKAINSDIIISDGKKYNLIPCNSKQEAKNKCIEMIADDNWEYLTKDKTEKEIEELIDYIL